MLVQFRRGLITAALFAAVALPSVSPLAQNLAVIEQRRALMKGTGDAVKAIKALLESKAAPNAALPHAELILANLEKAPALFGSDTKTGGETKALPDIWNNQQAFTNNMNASKASVETLILAAKGNDPAVLASAFQAAGKACGTCHDGFRAK